MNQLNSQTMCASLTQEHKEVFAQLTFNCSKSTIKTLEKKSNMLKINN